MKGKRLRITCKLFVVFLCAGIFFMPGCSCGGSSGETGSDTDPETVVNNAPVAYDSSVTTAEDTARDILLSAIDSDGDDLTWHVETGVSHGTLSQVEGNRWNYIPEPGYNGSDSFSFHVEDGEHTSNSATVSITVGPVNDPPVASDVTGSTTEKMLTVITFSASDPEGDSLTYEIDAQPLHGTLSTVSGNQVNYTPDDEFDGIDYFTWHAFDGNDDSAMATAAITVSPSGTIYYVVSGGSGSLNGSSWANAFGHPQDAVDAAGSGDQVWIAAGSYTGTGGVDDPVLTMKAGVRVYGGFTGTESFRSGRNSGITTLDGESGVYHVVSMGDTVTGCRLDSVTITGGNANGENAGWEYRFGGGVLYNGDNNIIANCTITGNSSDQCGGGIGYYSGNGGLTLVDCEISNNSAATYGGGVYSTGSSMIVKGCVFYGNTSDGGGVMYTCADSTTFTDSVFYNNTGTTQGSVLYALEKNVQFANCLFYGNISQGTQANVGGTVSVSRGVVMGLNNCTFEGNSSAANGGCLFISDLVSGCQVTVTDCIMWSNNGAYGVASQNEVYDYDGSGNGNTLNVYNSLMQNGVPAGTDSSQNIITTDPGFVSGPKGDYYLPAGSFCIDYGSRSASDAGLDTFTTSINGTLDSGLVDLGYHYRP